MIRNGNMLSHVGEILESVGNELLARDFQHRLNDVEVGHVRRPYLAIHHRDATLIEFFHCPICRIKPVSHFIFAHFARKGNSDPRSRPIGCR